MAVAKTALIKARVSKAMKEAVAERAAERGESEGLIVREALTSYLKQSGVQQESRISEQPAPDAYKVRQKSRAR